MGCGRDICMYRADSVCCSAETNTTLQSNYKEVTVSRSVVPNSATSWTAAHQAPVSMRFFQASILEWVAIYIPILKVINYKTIGK